MRHEVGGSISPVFHMPDLSPGLEGIVQAHEIDLHPFSAHPQESQG